MVAAEGIEGIEGFGVVEDNEVVAGTEEVAGYNTAVAEGRQNTSR